MYLQVKLNAVVWMAITTDSREAFVLYATRN